MEANYVNYRTYEQCEAAKEDSLCQKESPLERLNDKLHFAHSFYSYKKQLKSTHSFPHRKLIVHHTLYNFLFFGNSRIKSQKDNAELTPYGVERLVIILLIKERLKTMSLSKIRICKKSSYVFLEEKIRHLIVREQYRACNRCSRECSNRITVAQMLRHLLRPHRSLPLAEDHRKEILKRWKRILQA